MSIAADNPRYTKGERVKFGPTPAALMVYGGRHPPAGSEGTVTTIAGAVGMGGPRGGMLYVDWDDYGTEGVFASDVEKIGRGTRGYRVEFVRTDRGIDAVLYDDKGRSLNLIHTGRRSLTRQREMELEQQLMSGAAELGAARRRSKNPSSGLSAKDQREFNAFLHNATDRQLQGIYDKESAAGRDEYVALTEAEAERRGVKLERRNPPPGLTGKGKRMYEHIKKGYQAVGEQRAKEIAARTVRKAAQEQSGLVKKVNPEKTAANPENPEGGHYGTIRDQTARTLWVDAYASFIDNLREDGHSRKEIEKMGFDTAGAGDDWMDVAPATPDKAYKAADELLRLYEKKNRSSIDDLLRAAAEADNENWPPSDEYAQEFGHYLAMAGVGHGVSWFDDHARFELDSPFAFEVNFDGDDLFWSGRA